ncbi:MAG: TRAP transporter small permease [Proteobacteria bacterium]|nr:TRAP transporter small permease [Pseudomonadota bacterium]
MINTLLRAIDGLCRGAAWLAALLLAALAVLGMVEILSRWWFNYSLPITFEYSSYMLGLVMLGGTAWALREGGHIRVTLIMQPLGERARRIVDLIGTTFALGVSLYLSAALVNFTARTLALGSVSFFPSQTPLGWPQAAFTAGVCLLSLALFARLLRLILGEPPEARKAGDAFEETL